VRRGFIEGHKWRIILKWFLRKQVASLWTAFVWPRFQRRAVVNAVMNLQVP
jgi:hypothetical protein